jgi:glycerol-3-phosphate O-acyltransferase/dihydroxyacetone phosphate acyltransferase
MGIVTAEAGMVGLKDLKPFYMRIFPSARRRLLKLPAIRRQLQMDLRDFVRTIGPSLGDVYSMKNMDWAAFQHSSRQESRGNLKLE